MKMEKLLQAVEIAAKHFNVPMENFQIVEVSATSCKLQVGLSYDDTGEVLLRGDSLVLTLIKHIQLCTK